MKRGDVLLISVLLVAALVILIPRWFGEEESENNHNNKTAVITVDGEVFKKVVLTEEEQEIVIDTEHGSNILKVHDHGIEMTEADCPDQVCLTFGFINKKSQSIVCLPHKVLVEIEGGAEGGDTTHETETDAVVN